MYTIGKIGQLVGLSRSTLLYYDSIGLLCPSGRSEAGYRLYSEEDRRRLEQVMLFRSLGIPLGRIRGYLALQQEGLIPVLLQRLLSINERIGELREQQKAILDMIEAEGSLRGARPRLRGMKELGKKAGITTRNYRTVHRLFEEASPKEHRRFLGFLGFTASQIRRMLKDKA